MMTGNWFCDVSNDGGVSWKRLDPTTIFPQSLGAGFWLRSGRDLTCPPSTDSCGSCSTARMRVARALSRIATASSQSVKNDPTVWTYWDFVAGDFGFPNADMDIRIWCFSRQRLYVGTDVFGAGRLVLRVSLQDIAGWWHDQLRLHRCDEVDEPMGRAPRATVGGYVHLGGAQGQLDARGVHDAGLRQHLFVVHGVGGVMAERDDEFDGPRRERLVDEAAGNFPCSRSRGRTAYGHVVIAWRRTGRARPTGSTFRRRTAGSRS